MKALREFPSGKDSLAGNGNWELILRITRSERFQRSPRLRSFLLYIAERTLLGRTEDVRELQIGCQVFGRPAEYNPNDDNIVRVSARQLRKRLEEYFEAEGKDEPVWVTIPTGSYVPVFKKRPAQPTPEERAAGEEEVPAEPEAAPAAKRGFRGALLPLLTASLALACAALLVQNLSLRRVAQPIRQDLNPVLATVFDSSRPTKIVISDTSFSFAQDIVRQRASLHKYVDSFPNSLLGLPGQGEANEIARQVLRRQYTSLADVNVTVRLIQRSAAYWERTGVFFARHLVARDLKGANLILVGSVRSNPWVEIFEKSMNFRFGRDDKAGQSFFVNTAPRPGEQDSYRAGGVEGQSAEIYAVVALVPNIDRDGEVLILAGTTNEATEAAGQFVVNDRQVGDLMRTLKLGRPRGRCGYFEAMLRSTRLAGMPRETTLVAWREVR